MATLRHSHARHSRPPAVFDAALSLAHDHVNNEHEAHPRSRLRRAWLRGWKFWYERRIPAWPVCEVR
ncbi:MAG: hypothetical protein M3380_05655 [Chloroflexota bacterium]|nr:hypothetical protein [Chloroflexota bacterium]